MSRFVLSAIVGVLALTASGATSLVMTEPCSGYELAGEDDGACPPMCVTCGCCAQAAEPVAIAVESSPDCLVTDVGAMLPRLPKSDSRDILHVPKLRCA